MRGSRRWLFRAAVLGAVACFLSRSLYAQPWQPWEGEERRIRPPPPEEVSLIGGCIVDPGDAQRIEVPRVVIKGSVTVVGSEEPKRKATPPKAHAPALPVATPAGLAVACFAAIVLFLTLLWATWRLSRGGTRKEPS